MSNSNRFLVGRVALVIWVSGFILVLGGCGSGFGAASPQAIILRAHETQQACEAQAGLTSAQSGESLTAARARCWETFRLEMAARHQEFEAQRVRVPLVPLLPPFDPYMLDPGMQSQLGMAGWTPPGQYKERPFSNPAYVPYYPPYPPSPQNCFGQC